MIIANPTQNIINQLQKFNILTELKSLESSNWTISETKCNKIVGA